MMWRSAVSSINFEGVWGAQGISPVTHRDALVISAKVGPRCDCRSARRYAERHRVGEAAGLLASSERVFMCSWPDALETELVSSSERGEVKRAAVKDQRMLNGIEAQMAVVQAGPDLWSDVKVWGISKGLLSDDRAGDTGRRDVDSIQRCHPKSRASEPLKSSNVSMRKGVSWGRK